MLLHWCTLKPSGPSNLAAVRFTSPVRLHSIRIFPTNARPFAQCPEVIAYVALSCLEFGNDHADILRTAVRSPRLSF
jgi:hypothetical protein